MFLVNYGVNKLKRKNESGVVVVEALIVVTIVIMFITVMLYLGMVLYQQAVVNIMANQTATSIAQIYGNTLHDPFTGYVDADGINEPVTYTNIRNQAYQDVIKQKADAFALYRLRSSRILNTGVTEVDVEIVPKSNELLKDQIVVTVRESHAVSLVSFFGVADNNLTFVGTGRADCVDLLDYLAGVPALGTPDGNAVIFRDGQECTVNFYKHYGDDRPLKTITVLQGYSVSASAEKTHCTMPVDVAQEKMEFSHWVTESGALFNAGTAVNEDMNVYGVWECTITFEPDGGTLVGMDNNGLTATVFGNVELPVAERENCTFAGWYTESDGKGEEFTGINVQGNITVYAKWICSVMFNPDGGDVSPDSADVIYGKSLQESGVSLPTPTRTDCTFAGWYTEYYGEGTEFKADQAIQGHTTVIAKWECIVDFLDDNGSKLFDSQTVVAGKTATLPTPERAHSDDGSKGWQFLGWQDSEGTAYRSEESVISGNTDLYAHWECKHDYTNDVELEAGTCTKRSKWQHTCQYCENIETYYGGKGNHSFTGRCNKNNGYGHNLGNDSYYMYGTHGAEEGEKPASKTVKGECVVCVHCNALWDGQNRDVEQEGWRWRNGEIVSQGMYCRAHRLDGVDYEDWSFIDRKNCRLHG